MKRVFVELPPFQRSIDALPKGQEVLKEIQEVLIRDPLVGDLITATGGLRKMRHAEKGRGKSGSLRVIYLYIPAREKIYLFVLYAKNEKSTLSAAEKKVLKPLVEKLKNEARK